MKPLELTEKQLYGLLTASVTPWITLPDGHKGIFQGVSREDGSGRCFNVEVLVEGVKKTVFGRVVG